MQVFLHRANDTKSMDRANALGIGVEVDLRTHHREVFLSHDPMYSCEDCWVLGEYVRFLPDGTPILLDFKETGIIDIVKADLLEWAVRSPLCIDLIAPDMYYAQSVGMKTLVRESLYEWIKEYRNARGMYEHAGYWVDYTKSADDLIGRDHYAASCYLVSPELHGWDLTDDYISTAIANDYKAVCTDYPERWLEAIR